MSTTTVRGLSAGGLLAVWEAAWPLEPIGRAEVLLRAARPDLSPDALASSTVGERDVALLALREATFGHRLAAVATCSACGGGLELELDTREFTRSAEHATANTAEVVEEGVQVRFRVPTTEDLAAIAPHRDPDQAARDLLERCLLSARREEGDLAADELSPTVRAAVAAAMAAADPGADLQLVSTCPACGEAWQGAFDVGSFLWAEIDVCARRLLGEVHVLAAAYSWAEQDILAMSSWRRQIYLEAVG
jgi:hypothetical protein